MRLHNTHTAQQTTVRICICYQSSHHSSTICWSLQICQPYKNKLLDTLNFYSSKSLTRKIKTLQTSAHLARMQNFLLTSCQLCLLPFKGSWNGSIECMQSAGLLIWMSWFQFLSWHCSSWNILQHVSHISSLQSSSDNKSRTKSVIVVHLSGVWYCSNCCYFCFFFVLETRLISLTANWIISSHSTSTPTVASETVPHTLRHHHSSLGFFASEQILSSSWKSDECFRWCCLWHYCAYTDCFHELVTTDFHDDDTENFPKHRGILW